MNSSSLPADRVWGRDDGTLVTVGRNLSTRYLVIGIDAIIGLLMMPFNQHYLGQAAWGLWLLTTSVNTYFTLIDLGYGGSVTRFVAMYRARRDAQSINEITSTLMAVFIVIGIVIYGAFVVGALHVDRLFALTPEQVGTARTLMLISGTQVALGIPFGVFGGVMNGFQRYDINNFVSIGSSVVVALVNVAMLLAGYGLVELVFATTMVRIASKIIYRRNAYRVFPLLSVNPLRFSWARLREVTGFSIYVTVLNWSYKLNYMTDMLVIGMYMGPVAVALWAVPRRLTLLIRSLTNQFNNVLMPVVVDLDARRKVDRLRAILVQGTRLSLFGAIPGSATLILLADRLIPAYMGPGYTDSVPVAQILATVVAFRVGNSTANVVLKGGGRIRLVAFTNAVVAVVNLTLSIIWIQRFGLVGQALGTLIPVAAGTLFVIWPAACRRVGIGWRDAFRSAAWPALWPLVVLVPVELVLRAVLPANLWAVALTAVVGGLCYAATFLAFAITRHDRTAMIAKLTTLTHALTRRNRVPAAA